MVQKDGPSRGSRKAGTKGKHYRKRVLAYYKNFRGGDNAYMRKRANALVVE